MIALAGSGNAGACPFRVSADRLTAVTGKSLQVVRSVTTLAVNPIIDACKNLIRACVPIMLDRTQCPVMLNLHFREQTQASVMLKTPKHQPAFANETFNITNGDVFTWENLWSTIAEIFGMEVADPIPLLLSETCYTKEVDWQALVSKYQLKPHSIRELVGDSFFYADALFNSRSTQTPPPAILSTIKLRQAGFHDCMDTEDMLRKWFKKFSQLHIFPEVL